MELSYYILFSLLILSLGIAFTEIVNRRTASLFAGLPIVILAACSISILDLYIIPNVSFLGRLLFNGFMTVLLLMPYMVGRESGKKHWTSEVEILYPYTCICIGGLIFGGCYGIGLGAKQGDALVEDYYSDEYRFWFGAGVFAFIVIGGFVGVASGQLASRSAAENKSELTNK